MRRKSIFMAGMIVLMISICGCSDQGEVRRVDLTKQLEESLQESREQEAREKAEREAREKAEREAKEKAEREAREKAEREAREKAEREAREKAEREAREKAEREAREKAEREEKERQGQEEREKKDEESERLLIGVWHSEPMDVSDIVLDGMKDAGKLEPFLQFDPEKLKLRVYLSFSKESKALFYLDYVSYQQLMDYVTKEVTAGVIRYFEDMVQNLGIRISVETYLKMLGISLDDYVADLLSGYTKGFQPGQHYEMYYRVSDGKLFVAEDLEGLKNAKGYFDFEVSAESLRLKEYYENGQPGGKLMGLTKISLDFLRD